MKKLLFLFGVLLLSIGSYAQGYTLDVTSGGVECYHMLSTCNGNTVVMVKFNNTNASPVTISWKSIFTTTEFPDPAAGFTEKQLVLPAGETFAVDCNDAAHADCILGQLDVSPAYPATITSYQFDAITVTP